MKKELIALGAALALVGTLTACSSTPADQNKGSAGSGATGSRRKPRMPQRVMASEIRIVATGR